MDMEQRMNALKFKSRNFSGVEPLHFLATQSAGD